MGAGTSATKRSPMTTVFRNNSGESKILVLGCMGSGKSTLCRLLVKLGKSQAPVLQYYQHTIQNNLLQLWTSIFKMFEEHDIDWSSYSESFNTIKDFRHRENFSEKVHSALLKLCSSNFIEEVKKKVKRAELPYNYEYLLANYDRILSKGFVPNDTDLLHMYSETCGLDVHTVRLNHSTYGIVEMPGHHIFRRKWIDFLNHTNVVIFVVDLSELCRAAFYSGHLKDKTLSIFKELLNNEFLRKANFILLFNKKDEFDILSQGYDFEQLAPQMKSGQEALSFYRNLFLHLSPVKKIYNHVVSLTKGPNLNSTIVDSLATIFKSNKENVQPV